jgi:hypothetical protein
MNGEGDGGRSTGIVVGLMILLVIGPAAAAHVAARWLAPESGEARSLPSARP